MNSLTSILQKQAIYERFRFVYQQQQLSPELLREIYADNIEFRDPVHEIHGLNKLIDYFDYMNANMNQCRFEFVDELVLPDKAHITWNMVFSHKRINGGKEQVLRGMSLLKFSDNKVHYHEDSYDIGAMVYENLPVLGLLTRWVKKKMAG
jgi:hypothetical protein